MILQVPWTVAAVPNQSKKPKGICRAIQTLPISPQTFAQSKYQQNLLAKGQYCFFKRYQLRKSRFPSIDRSAIYLSCQLFHPIHTHKARSYETWSGTAYSRVGRITKPALNLVTKYRDFWKLVRSISITIVQKGSSRRAESSQGLVSGINW